MPVEDSNHADATTARVLQGLITGDTDFVPLVRRITSLNKHALVAHFEIESWVDARGVSHRPTFCSRALIDAASWTLNFNNLVRDPNWKTEVKSLFFRPNSSSRSR